MDLYIASNILAVVNSASTNKGVHISFPNSVFVFLELIPRSTITLGFINLSHYFGVGVSTVIISPLIFIIPFLLLTLGFVFFLISLDCSVCCLFEDILLIFFNQFVSCHWIVWVLYICWVLTICGVHDLQTFSPTQWVAFLFSLDEEMMISFAAQRSFSLIQSCLLIFAFVAFTLGMRVKNYS